MAMVRRVVGVPLEPVRDEQADARFQDLLRQLSWLRHPDLVRPQRLSIELDVVYSWGPEPSPLSLKEHLQRTSPPLPILLGWLQELCSLVDECHQNQPPVYLGRLNLSCLRWRDQRPQLVGLVVTRQLQLGFESHDPSWSGPPEATAVAASNVRSR